VAPLAAGRQGRGAQLAEDAERHAKTDGKALFRGVPRDQRMGPASD
jgi:hypothetical protein